MARSEDGFLAGKLAANISVRFFVAENALRAPEVPRERQHGDQRHHRQHALDREIQAAERPREPRERREKQRGDEPRGCADMEMTQTPARTERRRRFRIGRQALDERPVLRAELRRVH